MFQQIKKSTYYWFELTRLRNLYRRFGVCFLIAKDDFCKIAIGLAETGDDGAHAVLAELVFKWLIIRLDADA